MRIKIKRGNHYPFPCFALFNPLLWVKKSKATSRSYMVKFTHSCLYNLHDEDQHDVNKLYGFSIGHHHKGSSFRFGWRPILKNNTIQIVAYEYHNGERQKTMPICEIHVNQWYSFKLVYVPFLNKSFYSVSKNGRIHSEFSNEFDLKKKSGLGYGLGVYFGGDETAPYDMVLYKERV